MMFGDCTETKEEMTIDSRDSKQLDIDHFTDDEISLRDTQLISINEFKNDLDDLSSELIETKSKSAMNINLVDKSSNPIIMDVSHELTMSSEDSSKEVAEMKCELNENKSEHSEVMTKIDRSLTPSPNMELPANKSNSTSPLNTMPKLRLNTLLASDPAMKPDARDLKSLHQETQSNNPLSNMLVQPKIQQDDITTMLAAAQSPALVKSVLKSTSSVEVPPRMKVFMCLPCGIGFSSPSTLEAHQAYYCSHRNKEVDKEGSSLSSVAMGDKNASLVASTVLNNMSGSNAAASGEPATKSIKTGKQYVCTQCSYSADKKVSLNRHMRMHQTSPSSTPSSNASNGGGYDESSSQQIDRYCSDCDIRFNNVKTYRAHKQHYCSSRRTEGQLTPKLEEITTNNIKNATVSGIISPQSRSKTPVTGIAVPASGATSVPVTPHPFLALPTNPILIIPYSIIRAASIFPGPLTTSSSNLANHENTCFTLENGALKPLASALNIDVGSTLSPQNSTNITSTVNEGSTNNSSSEQTFNESLLMEKNIAEVDAQTNRKDIRDQTPLDLSLRRSPINAILQRHRFLESEQQRFEIETLLEAGKENLSLDESGTLTPEQIVCAPSLPNSPSMSPSPKRRLISPRSSSASSTSSVTPPDNASTASLAAIAASTMLENLPLRSILPADIALKLSKSNIINPLLAKQNLELALKLSAAAAAAVNSSSVAAMASGNNSSVLGLPILQNTAAASGATQPQIYVKQGVSKCKECNIVFCKYENYLAHKQHYCSARNHETSDTDVKVSKTPPLVAGTATTETTPVAYQQLICAACGIKYTSLDNLRAHQNYYCPKGNLAASATVSSTSGVATTGSDSEEVDTTKVKCTKCKTIHEVGMPCPLPSNLQQQNTPQSIPGPSNITNLNQNTYKCLVCDVVSITANESRKHMETHGTVKAFRCIICRYKGNTLRGMRTHIRMHFDKKTTDFNEENYMLCIMEDENVEMTRSTPINQEQILQQQQQSFNCEICNYSSSYKGNVLRHIRLVHSHANISESLAASPELGDLDISEENSVKNSFNGDNGIQDFTIKTEPVDHSAIAQDNNLQKTISGSQLSAATTSILPNTTNTCTELIQQIKSEPMDVTLEDTNSLLTKPTQSLSQIAGQSTHLNTNTEENLANSAMLNKKYCQTCDISFNYMKTFLAHKQFYCKNKIRRPEANQSPSPTANTSPAFVTTSATTTVAVAMRSPGSPMLQKNEDSLQQEGAI
ncbi:zinc finger protein ush [Teleopsis dalmanni]|uniref:zinc finger protein ush n=1 Tax=Teleopsis dalmanni TaxID=139649 RepID=UPI0018CF8C9F|nr:zinc finger protein ush [Teleopsis dalmanni]